MTFKTTRRLANFASPILTLHSEREDGHEAAEGFQQMYQGLVGRTAPSDREIKKRRERGEGVRNIQERKLSMQVSEF